MDILEMIADERRGMADLVEALDEKQLATQSLCGEWSVREVIGHVTAAVAAPRSWLLPALVRGGFNVHRANTVLARRLAARSPAELAATLRENATNPFKPPLVGYHGPLTDLQVHGQDIRRPLGLANWLRPDRLRLALEFLTGGTESRPAGFVTRKRLAGLRFEATDLDWSSGTGPTVAGEAEAVMLALCGRPIVLPELTGDGVPTLTTRLTP
ncbi:maleylpyruvate isomerase family mycothiol-dependent enzyme [Actinoplanes sp. NPDC051851]|uniref:maleylpyruvate isomerase family mycothiol-dependent enzyme n=1 Tax=Actinoplanes sp. NPDC051851 TaxID=3154753 RepID=UPI0034233156